MSLMMRPFALLAASALLFGAASCGTAQGPGMEASGTTTDTTKSARITGGWGMGIDEPPRPAGEPLLVDQLAVFHEKRTERDILYTCCPSAHTDTVEGREYLGHSRLLHPGARLFGVPTIHGWVCPHFASPDGEDESGSSCWSTLRHGISVAVEAEGDPGFYQVFGVTANDVKAVTVVAAGRSVPASMGRNSYVFGAKTIAVCPADLERLLVERTDGKTETIDLTQLLPPGRMDRAAYGCR